MVLTANADNASSGRKKSMSSDEIQKDQPIADTVVGHWVNHGAPQFTRPYLRLARVDRPIGTWLLLWPCWWSIAMATSRDQVPDIWLLALFAIGAFLMRAAGCTFNDIVDKEFDAKVERTRLRPLPSGQITVFQAWIFLLGLVALSFLILLTFNPLAVVVGLASLPLIVIYPFMKRVTYWPQLFLGLTFNWGAMLGWAAVSGEVPVAALLLFTGGILWTLGYDTIYAHQDKEDDALIGVKSTALKFGKSTKSWLFAFYGGAVLLIGLSGVLAGMGIGFQIGLLVLALHFIWQIRRVDIENSASCLGIFRSNALAGWLLFIGATLDRWI